MIADGAGLRHAPGALLVEGTTILAAGTPEAVGAPDGAAREDRTSSVVVPALVNAHAHLDLTRVGPRPYPGDFVAWIDAIRARRPADVHDVAEAVRAGIALSIAGGTAAVGDIAGVRSPVPLHVLRASPLAGTSYLETFGAGRRQADAVAFLRSAVERVAGESGHVRLGLQPHAPYSCGLEVYRAAAETGRPLATHLAETPEEVEYVRSGTGPLARMLRRLRVWDETIEPAGVHPVDLLEPVLRAAPFLLAHLNYVEDAHVELLARAGASVAYCPRASAYFGHPQPGKPPHRYRHMLEAGVNVALGTDSLVCLDTPDRLSVLDDMRLLHRRDGTSPQTLLRMATVHGAAALGLDPDLARLAPGPVLGLLALPCDPRADVDPLAQVLRRDDAPAWLAGPGAPEAPAG